MLEVTYSMLALTAVLLFPALVQYILRNEKKKTEQQQQQLLAEHQQHAQKEHQQQQHMDGNESLSSCVSSSGRDADDNTSNDIMVIKYSSSSSSCEPQSPASVVYVKSFDDDNADMINGNSSDKKKTENDVSLLYRPFNIFPFADYYSSDESDESLLEANQPEDFHKLLSQTGSEMMRVSSAQLYNQARWMCTMDCAMLLFQCYLYSLDIVLALSHYTTELSIH